MTYSVGTGRLQHTKLVSPSPQVNGTLGLRKVPAEVVTVGNSPTVSASPNFPKTGYEVLLMEISTSSEEEAPDGRARFGAKTKRETDLAEVDGDPLATRVSLDGAEVAEVMKKVG